MPDALTARLVLALVAMVALMLYFLGTYWHTRARYALWWCLALVGTGASTAAYAFNGTELQGLLSPVANVLAVAGTCFVWFATRAIRGRRPVWSVLAAMIVVVLGATASDQPAENEWAGAGFLLWTMLVCLVLATIEVHLLLGERPRTGQPDSHDGSRVALVALYVAAVLFGLWYAARLVGFLAWGADDARLEQYFGTVTTSVVLSIVLIIATYGMGELSHYERTRELRLKASYDFLTGLLTRAEFLARAESSRRARLGGQVLIMADLDHFKALNDALGHAAGDRALHAFGAVCRRETEAKDVVGRVGGEEFALLLDTEDIEEARDLALRISQGYDERPPVRFGRLTASYGATVVTRGEPLALAMRRADDALYRAKEGGRDLFLVGLATEVADS